MNNLLPFFLTKQFSEILTKTDHYTGNKGNEATTDRGKKLWGVVRKLKDLVVVCSIGVVRFGGD